MFHEVRNSSTEQLTSKALFSIRITEICIASMCCIVLDESWESWEEWYKPLVTTVLDLTCGILRSSTCELAHSCTTSGATQGQNCVPHGTIPFLHPPCSAPPNYGGLLSRFSCASWSTGKQSQGSMQLLSPLGPSFWGRFVIQVIHPRTPYGGVGAATLSHACV